MSNHDLFIAALLLVHVLSVALISYVNNKIIDEMSARLDAMSAHLDAQRIHIILRQK